MSLLPFFDLSLAPSSNWYLSVEGRRRTLSEKRTNVSEVEARKQCTVEDPCSSSVDRCIVGPRPWWVRLFFSGLSCEHGSHLVLHIYI